MGYPFRPDEDVRNLSRGVCNTSRFKYRYGPKYVKISIWFSDSKFERNLGNLGDPPKTSIWQICNVSGPEFAKFGSGLIQISIRTYICESIHMGFGLKI